MPGVCILYLVFILISRESDDWISASYEKSRFSRAPFFDDQIRIARSLCEKYRIPPIKDLNKGQRQPGHEEPEIPITH